MLGLGEGKYQDEENREWEEADKNLGFHPLEENPSLHPWEVRVATKALEEMKKED